VKPWQGVLVLVWVEIIAIALAFVHFTAYRDPSRNRMTRFVTKYWQDRVDHPLFGFSLFRSARDASLFQAILAAGLGLFFLVALLIGGFR
jgi:hypothetical protein